MHGDGTAMTGISTETKIDSTQYLNPNRRVLPNLAMEGNDEPSNGRDVRSQSRFHNAMIQLSLATSC